MVRISLARKLICSILLASLSVVPLSLVAPRGASAQVRPIYDIGSNGLGQALKRLQTTASAMHTAAHPDDEDSGLLAYLARKEQARTAYLSLTRGDGGQNVIGEELSESLGVIRTEELLQARRLDGGTQMFTRAMDYGFSKKLDEAARMWGEREVLADMVLAIRKYRPLIIISRFAGTPADGHGQHQFAGYLTPIAFKAAANPKEFPEQLKNGIEPWQALKLYVSQGFARNPQNAPTLTLNTGEYDPLIGRSYFEVAMEGRSQHKSQEMGVLELRGRQVSGLRLVENFAGKADNESSVFDGIDTSIKGISKLTNDTYTPFVQKLAELQETVELALKTYDPYAPAKLVPILAKGYKLAREAEGSTRQPDSKLMMREKQREFARALQLAAGIVVDALSDVETINAGGSTNVAVRVFAPEGVEVRVSKASLKVPEGWSAQSIAEPTFPETGSFRPRREEALNASFFKITAPENAEPTQPYWLEKPRKNFNFDWSVPDAVKNAPFQDPLVTAEVTMSLGGQEFEVERDVEYRYPDAIRGELRRQLNVVPAVTIGLESGLLVVGASKENQKRRLVMTVQNNTPGEAKGTASFDVPAGWTLSPRSAEFDLQRPGDKTALTFEVTIPANAKPDSYKLQGKAIVDGRNVDRQMQVIAYPHIQTHRIYRDATVTAQVLDLKVEPVKVGYIMGSGDKVPEAIRHLGLDVTMLGETDLSTGNLNEFDTIVVGIRASQVRLDYVANNGRLLDFVKNGGTLIVQYQQQEFIRENLAPFPVKMESVVNGTQRVSNVRVVDETAPVTILAPAHPVFNYPNKITGADFDNWVQERNLYSLTGLDPRYTPLLSTQDEGESPVNGGLVYAKFGKGNFVYNSYSFFRQLPAGNPGAYRLFANLLILPKAPAS